jgi:hypothetical protein
MVVFPAAHVVSALMVVVPPPLLLAAPELLPLPPLLLVEPPPELLEELEELLLDDPPLLAVAPPLLVLPPPLLEFSWTPDPGTSLGPAEQPAEGTARARAENAIEAFSDLASSNMRLLPRGG